MIDADQAQHLIGTTAYDSEGSKLGKVGQVFLDDATERPEFITVVTGFFGTNESFIPVGGATFEADRVVVPLSKDKVKDAPNVAVDGGHLDESEQNRLFEYYGLGTTANTGNAGYAEIAGYAEAASAGHDTSGPNTDTAMTRSEGHLEIGTRTEESGRARLRKYVTTETETVTVPVTQEHAVVESEPIHSDTLDPALDGPAISEEEHEVVLHEERAVAQKTVEPVERVRLGTETAVEQESVTDKVRKEQIEVEGDVDDRRV